MQTLEVSLENRAYPICIGAGLLKQPELITRHLPQKRAAVVTDSVVAPLYLPALTATLKGAGIEVTPVIVPAGEQHKDWQSLNAIFDALLAARCERKTALIALGCGVVGDLTGFAAATYLRGVPFIQIPTTLLALVDSSVGGKTAINHPRGKNMIGAFYQPQRVVCDLDTLQTLPQRELSAGLAEVIKYGPIADMQFLEWLENNLDALMARDPKALGYAVQRSCEIKAYVTHFVKNKSCSTRISVYPFKKQNKQEFYHFVLFCSFSNIQATSVFDVFLVLQRSPSFYTVEGACWKL